ncbi:unnamed protein product [Phyllotreta striolata]|uniref:RNA-binding protein NOB1 n=1 Tax=Phyllotreta striolata TaxID=444603 RepID=A0A9N9TWP4_PHYSR|nr:unnamed protein product [Phyllotreta striolata]
MTQKPVNFLVVDTTAFLQNAPLQDVAGNIITCPEVVDEIKNKRQLRRLIVLPYDLIVKEVFPESVLAVTEFSKKTGDYPSLSATDIKVLALTYQLEKEKVGTEHLRKEPVMRKAEVTTQNMTMEMQADVTGFFIPKSDGKENDEENESSGDEIEHPTENEDELKEKFGGTEAEEILEKLEELELNGNLEADNLLVPVKTEEKSSSSSNDTEEEEDDDDDGWITPSNVKIAKQQVNSKLIEEKHVEVACMTTDFAMQNVLKQMNLNVSALDGRLIKRLRTFILRCYTCFKTTSIMTKKFCPKCGNNTLKRVSVSLDEDGKMQIHINPNKPLTARGKKYSLPRIRGGKHPNNPILVEDQPMPQNRPSRLAKTKNNPLDDDYIAGFSPFVTRDVNSRSAKLCIRPDQEVKYWMSKNPNESRRRKK